MEMRETANQRKQRLVLDRLRVPLIQGFQNTLQASVNDLVVQSLCTSALICLIKISTGALIWFLVEENAILKGQSDSLQKRLL